MKRGLRSIAQGLVVQVAGLGPTLERQMLEQSASGAEFGGASWKRLAPLPPLLTVEFLQRRLRFNFLFFFSRLQNREQRFRCRIRRGLRQGRLIAATILLRQRSPANRFARQLFHPLG